MVEEMVQVMVRKVELQQMNNLTMDQVILMIPRTQETASPRAHQKEQRFIRQMLLRIMIQSLQGQDGMVHK